MAGATFSAIPSGPPTASRRLGGDAGVEAEASGVEAEASGVEAEASGVEAEASALTPG